MKVNKVNTPITILSLAGFIAQVMVESADMIIAFVGGDADGNDLKDVPNVGFATTTEVSLVEISPTGTNADFLGALDSSTGLRQLTVSEVSGKFEVLDGSTNLAEVGKGGENVRLAGIGEVIDLALQGKVLDDSKGFLLDQKNSRLYVITDNTQFATIPVSEELRCHIDGVERAQRGFMEAR